MTVFIFVRHGEPDWNLCEEKKLVGARRDLVPLTIRGVKQAEMTRNETSLQGAELILTSPYTRTLQTAYILNEKLALPLQVEIDLHEWIPDKQYSYTSSHEVDEFYQDFREHKDIFSPNLKKNWETREEIQNRVWAVLQKYTHYDRVIVVNHGIVIEVMTGISNTPHGGIVEMRWNR
ncbi:histidine phosphatase family protein [Brevibacillus sp. SYSU BS000544]|uniref:histidine phosphatase family protein n=1 Tax=Brevibacillus sp. SYSU BS000544 TaxID=3416443 RepID=UPI003CE5A38C